MLMMVSPADSQAQHLGGLHARGREAIEHPKPPQVRIEVLGGHPLEAAHPPAQPADIGIDVLHMPGASDAHAAADVDRLMLDAQGMRAEVKVGPSDGYRSKAGKLKERKSQKGGGTEWSDVK